MATADLFQGLQVGPLSLRHRVVLAPLTRLRASEPDLCPRDMHVDYYSQRATPGGLLITEATSISPEALGYPHTPGIWTDAQVEAWQRVTAAVHAKGGFIVCQLWHVGRVSHPSYSNHPLVKQHPHKPHVSASDVPLKGRLNTYDGLVRHVPPRPLSIDELPRLRQDYRHAAECAKRAGFDGVEVHGAHGYLLDQFLNTGTNKRTDIYGGSIVNRSRLLLEVLKDVIDVWGPQRVAVRISPHSKGSMKYFQVDDEDPEPLYYYVINQLNGLPLLYLLLTEPRWTGRDDGDPEKDPGQTAPIVNGTLYRQWYRGVLLGAGGFTPKGARDVVSDGTYDAVAFGRWFIANPDLPDRIQHGRPLNIYNRDTFYSYEEDGYTDYPSWDGSVGVKGKYSLMTPKL